MPKKKKNAAAVALARKRWAGKTQAEKNAVGEAIRAAAAESMTDEQKKDRARKAAKARWANHRKAKPRKS
jgi:hypothetical protein